jgi:hypothetical protein
MTNLKPFQTEIINNFINNDKKVLFHIERSSGKSINYNNQERIEALMQGWTSENKASLYAKMKKLGISKGGFLSSDKENIELFNYLMKQCG